MTLAFWPENRRVLVPKGKYIYVTFGQPHFRKPLILKDKYDWELRLETIGKREQRLNVFKENFFTTLFTSSPRRTDANQLARVAPAVAVALKIFVQLST